MPIDFANSKLRESLEKIHSEVRKAFTEEEEKDETTTKQLEETEREGERILENLEPYPSKGL